MNYPLSLHRVDTTRLAPAARARYALPMNVHRAATGTSVPTEFTERMQRLLGERDAAELLRALANEPRAGLRINTLKLRVSELAAVLPWPLEPVPWCSSGFLLPEADEARPGTHPFHNAGFYYLQEPSAMAVAEAVAPRAGDRVLDLAAAPGGKSTHLLSLLGGTGVLVANEVTRGRTRALLQNLERWGARNAVATSAPVRQLADAWGAAFDRVLLDAPCSGEGMFRKSSEAIDGWSPGAVQACARRQDDLLRDAARLVRPGGRLVYSTCTFAPEEDEGAIARFLNAHEEFEAVPASIPGAASGRPDWLEDADRSPAAERAARHAARLWPHRGPGEGHFIAVLERPGGSEDPPSERRRRAPALPEPTRTERDAWRSFARDALGADVADGARLARFGDALFALPDGMPETSGLHVLRAGLPLATFTRGRLEPTHALALSLSRDELRAGVRALELPSDGRSLAEYLHGLELESPGEDGWVLVTTMGAGVGWGRRSRGIVKNAYPKGLRRPLP